MAKPEVITKAVAEISLKDMALQEIGKVGAGLAQLTEMYADKTYDVITTVGMDAAKVARADIREKRYKIPHIVKEKKQELKKIGEDIQAEGDRITELLLNLETPIDEQIKAEEQRKAEIKAERERLEAERKDAINAQIDKIRNLPLKAVDAENAAELELFIGKVKAMVIDERYAEFVAVAQTAKDDVVVKLEEMLSSMQTKEAEALRIKQEQEDAARLSGIRDRIRVIQDWPRSVFGLDSFNMKAKRTEYSDQSGIFEGFDELHGEALHASVDALAEIDKMIDTATAQETEAARLKEQQAEQDRINKENEEKFAAERKELDDLREMKRLKDEADEKERKRVDSIRGLIAEIKAWPLKCLNLSAFYIRSEIEGSEMDIPCLEKDYAEFTAEAEAERLIALSTMTTMADAAEAAEKAEADRAALAAKDKEKSEQEEKDRVKKAEEEAEEKRKADAAKLQKEHDDRMEKLTSTHLSTLQAILDMAQDKTVTDSVARKGIISLAAAGIKRGAK